MLSLLISTLTQKLVQMVRLSIVLASRAEQERNIFNAMQT